MDALTVFGQNVITSGCYQFEANMNEHSVHICSKVFVKTTFHLSHLGRTGSWVIGCVCIYAYKELPSVSLDSCTILYCLQEESSTVSVFLSEHTWCFLFCALVGIN